MLPVDDYLILGFSLSNNWAIGDVVATHPEHEVIGVVSDFGDVYEMHIFSL